MKKSGLKRGAGQDRSLECGTFEAAGMEHGLEPLQEEDYKYFFRITGLSEGGGRRCRILEVGCGSGPFGRRLAVEGHKVTGIDLSRPLVEAANRLAAVEKSGYRAYVKDVFDYKKDGFDIVLCAGFLHHFVELGPILLKLRSFLKKGGDVVIIEPNGSNPAVKMTEWLRKNVWPFNKMSALGTLNETSHSAETYIRKFGSAGFTPVNSEAFIKKPKFDNYGPVMNVLLASKYLLHVIVSVFMQKGIRGTVLVMRFRK
ncbi:MAG: class I SAM-dependent methyltransferase [Spirochaetia bacterium]|nr:class I SAM-dependent methyltransferase [Spirochaetia bacterium]